MQQARNNNTAPLGNETAPVSKSAHTPAPKTNGKLKMKHVSGKRLSHPRQQAHGYLQTLGENHPARPYANAVIALVQDGEISLINRDYHLVQRLLKRASQLAKNPERHLPEATHTLDLSTQDPYHQEIYQHLSAINAENYILPALRFLNREIQKH